MTRRRKPLRPNPLEEGERWLAQATADLRWVRHLAQEGGWHLACFLAQQVTEKALKAFLYAQAQGDDWIGLLPMDKEQEVGKKLASLLGD